MQNSDDALSMFEVCVCYVIRHGTVGPEVLLGRKKFGVGAGNLVGPGGKLDAGETAIEAIMREVREETSLVVSAPVLIAEMSYPFPFKPAWSQRSWVFFCRDFTGTPIESDELVPEWFAVDSLPVEQMWDDAKYWLPALLGEILNAQSSHGQTSFRRTPLRATFEFGADLRTVTASDHPAFPSPHH